MRLLYVFLGITLCLPPCMAQVLSPSTTNTTPGGARTLTLLKPDGAPAAGAKVIARTFKGSNAIINSHPRLDQERTYTADAKGQLTIDIAANVTEHRSYADYGIIFAPGCCVTVLPLPDLAGQLKLLPEATTDITLSLPNGKPAANADITLVSMMMNTYQFNNMPMGIFTPQLTVRADANGKARIPLINFGRFQKMPRVQVQALASVAGTGNPTPWYCAYPITIQVGPDVTPMAVTLQQTIALTGSVTTVDGKPIAGVSVSNHTLHLLQTTTDAGGQYRSFALLPQGASQVHIMFAHAGYAPVKVTLRLPTTAPLVTVLQPLVTVRGRVVDAENGTPLAGTFTIRALHNTGYTPIQTYVDQFTTAPDGSFTIRIAAHCKIWATGAGYDGQIIALEKTFTDNDIVELKVQKVAGGR